MRKLLISALGVGAALLAFGLFSAQVPSSNPPYNVDTGTAGLINLAITSNGLGVANSQTGIVNSASQTNLDKAGAVCTYAQTASSGSPSLQFSIQGFDAASGQWYTMALSAQIANPTTSFPYQLWVQPGLVAADIPGQANNGGAIGVGKSTHLPRVWRVQVIAASLSGAGSTTDLASVVGKVGCNLFK